MKTNRAREGLLVVLCLLCVSCSHILLTPKQTVLWALNVYNAQYDLYLKQASKTDLTEDEKVVLRVKRDVLIDLEAALNIATADISAGIPPDDEVQDDIVYLVNRLLEGL